MDIRELIEKETHTTFARRGREYHGPCPFCGCTNKQFVIFTTGKERYWCRQCGAEGDAVQFVRDYKRLSFREACAYLGRPVEERTEQRTTPAPPAPMLQSPGDEWGSAAASFVESSRAALWADPGAKALGWLRSRGLDDATIRRAGLGYNTADTYADRQDWGLPPETTEQGRAKGLWLPRGIVIPWCIDGALWCIRIRRPVGEPKYYFVPGGAANALYNADALTTDRAAMILEGEIDALTVGQQAGELVAPVATGGTASGRRAKWIGRLSLAPTALVAYDTDATGDSAAAYWVDALPNARRWRPYWADANDMARAGVDLLPWVRAGLGTSAPSDDATPEELAAIFPIPVVVSPIPPATPPAERTHRVHHLGDPKDPKFDTAEEMTEEQYRAFVRANTWPTPVV